MRYQVGDQPIPGYRLEAFLGAGSYGEVWRAGGPGGVPCALKFISLDSKSGLKEFRSIRLVKKLQHPNLCPVQAIWLRDPDGNVLSDSGEDSISIRLMGPKELVIAMGLGQKSLAQRLDELRTKGGIPARELLRYMSDASKGIDYLNSAEHDLGSGPAAIIHCDIKPANLLVVGGGVQVCDYGVAKAIAPDSKKTFAAGTPAYAPPELINNEPCPQTDQYSLAVTYYELRTGRLPFDEERAIVANLMGQLDFSGVGRDEQEVLRQATHKQPTKRFESCEEFVEALKLAANITLGPSGVVKPPPPRIASPPPEEAPLTPPEPVPVSVAPKGLSDLLQPGGELVPDHFLTKLLGRGGFGEVWEARASGGVRCALKVVRDLQGRGKQEFAVLETISKLDHPCLVQLRGYWLLAQNGSRVLAHQVGLAGVPDPSIVVISTDLAEKNLLDRLKECKADGLPGVPPDELVNHIRQAAVALDYLNIKHHIQHRDVKPENLLLRGDRLLVSDFGLAKLVEGDGGAVQSSSSGMTLEYAAPELLQKKVSSRTDQYSLALTYYTLRTGRMPFPPGMGQFDTMQARIKGQLDLSGVPEAERAVLRKALAPNPADRFGSCEELARQLAHASGVGTGSMPSLPSGGPDVSRVTPSDLPPRMTPPAQSRAARGTPNYPVETPRISARPGEIPLIPAETAGTIMFGDQPPTWPGPANLRTTPAPWAGDEIPKATKTERPAPQWNESSPAPDGGTGRTVAVIGGVVILLALATAGVVYLTGMGTTGTVASGGTTKTSGKGGEGSGGTVSTGKPPDTRAERIAALIEESQRLIRTEQFDAAKKKIDELKELDEAAASQLERERKAAITPKEPETPDDNRVTKAAEYFKPENRNIEAGLAELAKIPGAPRASALRTAWERAGNAARAADAVSDAASLLKFRDEFANPLPTGSERPTDFKRLTEDDLANLKTRYRELLAKAIRAAVPGLAEKWPEVAALCDEAMTARHADPKALAWVALCRAECRAEQNVKLDDTDKPTDAADPELAGYAKYVAALRGWRDGTDDPKAMKTVADAAVALVPAKTPTEPGWLSPYRLGRLADLLWAARGPLRTPDDTDLEHPYAKDTGEQVVAWLTAAARAAEMARRPAADRTRFDYELLLANWSLGQPIGYELTRLGAKFADSLAPAPRARFGVVLATARPNEAAAGYRAVFDALHAEGSPALRDFATQKVLLKLTSDQQIDRQPGGPELLTAAGRELFRHRRAWATVKDFPGAPAAVAAGLFDRANDHAWAGLCRTEVPGTSFKTLTDDLAAARKAGTGPATRALEALVAARKPWADPKVLPGRSEEVSGLTDAAAAIRTAIAACRGDKGDHSDELALLTDRAAAVAVRLAEESAPDKVDAQIAVLDNLAAEARGRLAGLEYAGRALEERAARLKTPNRFDKLDGEYAKADRSYAWSGGLFGTARSTVNRARNRVRWAADQYHNGNRDLDSLTAAEELLRRATDPAHKAVLPREAAEVHYWLGQAALLRYEDSNSAATRFQLAETALKELTAASRAAAGLDEDTLSDAVLRSALAAADRGAKAAGELTSPDKARKVAAQLDELADRTKGRPLTPTGKAALKVQAVRIREAAGSKKDDWFGKLKDAAAPGLAGDRDRERDLKLDLLVTLAEGCGAKLGRKPHYDPKAAAGYARQAVKLADAHADLPAGLRSRAHGTLGMLQYRGNKKEERPDARRHLEAALDLLPGNNPNDDGNGIDFPPGWQWRYALGTLDYLDSSDSAGKKKDAEAADLAVRAMNRFLPLRYPLFKLLKAADADPDDVALANEFVGPQERIESNVYNSCKSYLTGVVATHKDDPRRPTWQLAAAELEWLLLTDKEEKGKAAEKVADAIKTCTAGMKKLDPKAAGDARHLIRQTRSIVGVK